MTTEADWKLTADEPTLPGDALTLMEDGVTLRPIRSWNEPLHAVADGKGGFLLQGGVYSVDLDDT